MNYNQTTQVPNILFDKYLPELTESELKLLLIIIRQTYGWIDKRTGKRKSRDRISHGQFTQKTGLSRKAITGGLKNLLDKGLICITNHSSNFVSTVEERRGKILLFYSFTIPSIFVEPRTQPTKINELKQVNELLNYPYYFLRAPMT